MFTTTLGETLPTLGAGTSSQRLLEPARGFRVDALTYPQMSLYGKVLEVGVSGQPLSMKAKETVSHSCPGAGTRTIGSVCRFDYALCPVSVTPSAGVEPPVGATLRRRPMRHTFLPLSALEAGGGNQGTPSFAGRAKRW
jgi:hypothetical protein